MDFKRLSFDLCRAYVNDHHDLVDAATRDKILGWIRSKDVARLSTCTELFPHALHTEANCRFYRQVAAFFKKNPAFADKSICSQAAASSFERGERICRIANKRIEHFSINYWRLPEDLADDIRKLKRVISDTLGSFEPFIQTLDERVRITAGASTTRNRSRSMPYLKARKRGLCSNMRSQIYLTALSKSFGYGSPSYKNLAYNRVVEVPKNWKTNRTIACEPEGNLSLQLALDSYIKERLLSLGVDLRNQFRNQEMSRQGSIDGSLATIDLSMASDTLAYNAVQELVPDTWFKFADDIRSTHGLIHETGELIRYAKFSSMGNGATFTLETLVFASMCKAIGVPLDRFTVYGDDIVIPVEYVDRLVRLLSHFGFRVNMEKSFTSGPFRESCGVDSFHGVDVTPFYFRVDAFTKPFLSHLVNGLASIAYPYGELSRELVQLVERAELKLCPFSIDTTDGVHITASAAYAESLIRSENSQTYCRKYVTHTPSRRVDDSRTLFLWHLDAMKRKVRSMAYDDKVLHGPVRQPEPTDPIVRSRVPSSTHKYKYKWVCWNPPAQATPVHLYWWTEMLIRES